MFNYEEHRSNLEGYMYHQKDTNLAFQMHIHNSYEFVFCYEGKLCISIEEKEYYLEQNECLLIPPMLAHSYKTYNYSKSYLCVFSQSFIPHFYKKYRDLIAIDPVFILKNPLETIEQLETTTNEFLKKSILYRIVGEICEVVKFDKISKIENNILHEIINYLSSNFSSDLTLKHLAVELGYSYNYISSLFNKTFKTNFLDVVNKYRINHAEQLLIKTEKNITVIATECGFNSLRSLNRNFKRHMGITPSEYRKSPEHCASSVDYGLNSVE